MTTKAARINSLDEIPAGYMRSLPLLYLVFAIVVALLYYPATGSLA